MSDFSSALSVTASGLRAQAQRLLVVSENIANADTPGFRRKTLPFGREVQTGAMVGEVRTGDVRLDQRDLPRIYDPAHPLADASGHYNGSGVDLIVELADARQAQRSYEANLKMFEQTRQMSSGLMDILRR